MKKYKGIKITDISATTKCFFRTITTKEYVSYFHAIEWANSASKSYHIRSTFNPQLLVTTV